MSNLRGRNVCTQQAYSFASLLAKYFSKAKSSTKPKTNEKKIANI
jgi:hypothetical protein